ncbi:hypothetical protein ScPMuIL_003911 [Solemya velum]
MKGNRLRACRKAVRRMAVSFSTPFLKSKDVKGNTSGDMYAVGDVNHDNTPDEKDERVLATDELGYTGSKLSKWINASARNHAEVTPVDDSTWSYLMGSEGPMNASPGISNRNASKVTPKHIGSLCKDYSIFEVSGNAAKNSLVGDYTAKKNHPKDYGKSSHFTKQPRCVPGSSFKHLGKLCKDYTIFQVKG